MMTPKGHKVDSQNSIVQFIGVQNSFPKIMFLLNNGSNIFCRKYKSKSQLNLHIISVLILC